MAEFTPNKAGPRDIRELYYYVYQELRRLGGMLGDIDDLGGGGGGGPETDPIFSASPAATITQQDINDWNAGLSGGGGVKEEIESITLTTAGEFDFGPALAGGVIPSGYRRLYMQGHVRSSGAGASDNMTVVLNADSTSGNYHRQHSAAFNGGAISGEGSDNFLSAVPGSGAPTGSYLMLSSVIEGYDVTGILKSVRANFWELRASRQVFNSQTTVHNEVLTAPVTRIRIRTDNHPTDGLIGRLTLYGEY